MSYTPLLQREQNYVNVMANLLNLEFTRTPKLERRIISAKPAILPIKTVNVLHTINTLYGGKFDLTLNPA